MTLQNERTDLGEERSPSSHSKWPESLEKTALELVDEMKGFFAGTDTRQRASATEK